MKTRYELTIAELEGILALAKNDVKHDRGYHETIVLKINNNHVDIELMTAYGECDDKHLARIK